VSGPVRSLADLADADDRRRELLFLDLLERGFYVAPRGFIALSIEVTDDDVDEFVAAVAEALAARS
jgi:glutamate-1-semialdehyde 2,1-aminomutase